MQLGRGAHVLQNKMLNMMLYKTCTVYNHPCTTGFRSFISLKSTSRMKHWHCTELSTSSTARCIAALSDTLYATCMFIQYISTSDQRNHLGYILYLFSHISGKAFMAALQLLH